jgi:tetratricopeptide (TPR) repeat protein
LNSEIQQYTEFLENNKSIFKKIICYKLRGVLYLKEELFIDAINDFTQSINLLNKINKWKRKVKLQTNQELGESYFYRGYAFAKINNIKKAIKDFDKALKKTPYCIDYEFFRKLDGEAKHILGTQLKLLKLFTFK